MEERVHNHEHGHGCRCHDDHSGECHCRSELIHEQPKSCDSECHCHEGHEHAHSHEHSHKNAHTCACGHCHSHGGGDRKKTVTKLIVSAVLLIAAFVVTKVLDLPGFVDFLIFLVPYLFTGWGVLKEALESIKRREMLDENFLMALATVGAFCIGEFHEAVFVMLFYRVGELFEELAEEKSKKSITELIDLRPDHACVIRGGEIVKVRPEEVSIGETIIVKAGERIPLDGVIIEGETSLNTSALTGESVPAAAGVGDSVYSSCVNLSGLIKIRVQKEFSESTVARILELMEKSAESKAKMENFITRFARLYTPIVVCAAVIVAFIPPIFAGDFAGWVRRALVFLVVSCPCSLVISVPLTFFCGMGCASKHGVLVKGSNYLEALSMADTVVFDKTGTLTKGQFEVTALRPVNCTAEQLLELAAYAESFSDHPIAQSICRKYGKDINKSRISAADEAAGHGVCAVVEGVKVCAGNGKLMEHLGVRYKDPGENGTAVHVSANDVYMGYIVIADEIKEDTAHTIRRLRRRGIKKTVMLTGDRGMVARHIAHKADVDEVHAELLPGDKVRIVEELIADEKGRGKVIFVGDGINDAPVIARADIGVSMGALGSDAAIEASDVVLMDDSLSALPVAIDISKRTQGIVIQNIVFSLGIKVIVMALGVMGNAPLWAATLADVGVMVLAVINAMRALKMHPAEDKELQMEAAEEESAVVSGVYSMDEGER